MPRAGRRSTWPADAGCSTPGSVGQPRDGDRDAAWLLLDLGAGKADFRRTSYDVEAAQEAIRAAGLPDALAERLAHGV